jgi:glycosyltransferase involved in cell wall biosynthesis
MSRVLLVTDIFPPDIGGPATFIPALGTALVEAGHRVTVVCRADDPRAPLQEAWPFRLLRTPRRGGASRRPRLLWTLWREARRHDVVFSNGLERATAWACRAGGRSYTVKVVGDLAWERARGEGLTELSLDEFQAAPAAGRPWRRWAAGQHAAARRARRVITPSDYLRRLVLGWGVEPARAVTVHNGIHLGEFAGLVPRPRPPGMPLQVLWIGRIVNHKGLEFLLEALARVDGVELDLAGDGPAAPRIRSLASRLGVDGRVRFHGLRPRADVLRHLARADVLVLPSEYEGLSHALLEAAAAGLACVASDRGGNPEIIEHGRSGLLWPYGRVDALRETLERLARDENLRLALARGAKARSAAFDFRETVARTIEQLGA